MTVGNSGFAPESLVLTSRGYEKMSDLEDKDIEYWDGHQFRIGSVQRSFYEYPLVTLRTNTYSEVECRPDQFFYIKVSSGPTLYSLIKAEDVGVGASVHRIPNTPICTGGDKEFPLAYSHGFYMGAERFYRSRLVLQRAAVFGYRRPCMEYLSLDEEQSSKHRVVFTPDHPLDFEVPLSTEYSVDTKLDWLSGLFDSGLGKRKIKPIPIWHMHSENVDFLYQIKLLLQTLGVDSRLVKNDDPKAILHYSLRIRAKSMEVLRDLGISTKIHFFESVTVSPNLRTSEGVRNSLVASKEDSYRTSHTYTIISSDFPETTAVINGMYVPIT